VDSFFRVSKRPASSHKDVISTRQPKRRRPTTGYYNESLSSDVEDEDEVDDDDSEANDDDDDDVVSFAAMEIYEDDEIPESSVGRRRSHRLWNEPDKTSTNDAREEDELVPAVTHTKARKLMKGSKAKTARTRLTKRVTKHSSSKNSKHLKIDTTLSLKTKSEPEVIPAWQTLPHFVLLRIFRLAAGDSLSLHSAKWLLGVCLLCRAFADPAITALYREPPLLTPAMARGFINLLTKPPEQLLFRYQHKVRRLSIDVQSVASKKYKGQPLDIKTIVEHLPQLTEIELWHSSDNPAKHELTTNLRWRYPLEVFEALGYQGEEQGQQEIASSCQLSAWTWNSRMMGDLTLDTVSKIHKTSGSQRLRKVTFLNFQLPSLDAADPDDPDTLREDNRVITALGKAICLLPDLKHLVLESSTAVTGPLLKLLPRSLEHLEINNCWDLTSEEFAEYLLTHGSNLRHLSLRHNQALSLGFLTVLGNACPLLQTLDMDLTYFSLRRLVSDTQPLYEDLLTVDQIPTWPSALRYLSIKPLRQLKELETDMFFQSLVASAANLSMLRHLEIKVLLNIPIRERIHMRDKWETKLKQVFLRLSTDPQPVHSLRQLNSADDIELVSPREKGSPGKLSPDGAIPSPRRSSRIATLPSSTPSRAGSVGRDVREGSSRPNYAEVDTDIDMLSDEEESQPQRRLSELAKELTHFSDEGPVEAAIQGMCDVVDIQFDNQKPTEMQWTADDFLDSEDSGADDDWTGDSQMDEGYAW
jgi:hypothetical protein